MEVISIEPRASVFRVATSQGPFCLKPVTKSQGRLALLHQVQEHVRSRGFEDLGFLEPAADGGIAVWDRGVAWTMSRWVEGRELKYSATGEIAAGAAVLARFHVATGDFCLAGRRHGRSNVGKWPSKVASRCGELLTAARAAAERQHAHGHACLDALDAELSAQSEALRRHSQRSLQLLSESSYAELSRSLGGGNAWGSAATPGGVTPICHGDPAAHNLILRPDGSVQMIDLNSLRVDLPCVDLWKLTHRMAFWRQWEAEPVVTVLLAYGDVRGLSPAEATALLGLLWFPEKQWRLVYNAGRHIERSATNGDRPPVPEHVIQEMAAAGALLPAKEQCLAVVEQVLLGSGSD